MRSNTQIRSKILRLLRPWQNVVRNSNGGPALEFAIIAQVVFLILIGLFKTAILFDNYLELGNAVRASSRVFANSRGDATPYTDATAVLKNGLPNVSYASLTVSLTVAPPSGSGVPCASDAACQTALGVATGGASTVAVTNYPCNLTFMGVAFIPACTLSATTTERIE